MAEEHSNLTILFVDVSDSTRLYESLGDAAAFRTVRDCLSMFERVALAARGRIVKTIGDGALCTFADADAAVRAACEMQAGMLEMRSPGERKIAIRIGMHCGPVLVAGDDVFGDTVNTAARMSEIADAGQIITTGETVERLSAQYRNATRQLEPMQVKGKQDAVSVYEILWQASSDHTLMPGRFESMLEMAGIPRLRVTYAGRQIMVIASITIGRDSSNGIALHDPMASRNHALIERRKDKFVLVDKSANGTLVSIKNGDEFRLHREEMILYGSGALLFGHHAHDKDAEVVGFSCESGNEVLPGGHTTHAT